MKAIGYKEPFPVIGKGFLSDITIDKPHATGRDLLVKINAISVNPVDYKVRRATMSQQEAYRILGWDAVGEVVETGEKVNRFRIGDSVYYAGDLTRPGCNAEYQLVDELIVAKKPATLTNAEAAALPLTALTAWEMVFEHLAIRKQAPNALTKTDDVVLVVGAAEGVGSIAIQLLKQLTGATVIATASREKSRGWVKSLGAEYVIDHTKSFRPQMEVLNIPSVTHVISLHNTQNYMDAYIDLLVPFGKIAFIDDPETLNVMPIKTKSLSIHSEFMFARSMYHARDRYKQGDILKQVAQFVDEGHIRSTLSNHFGIINAENLQKAHQQLESMATIGKIVLENFK